MASVFAALSCSLFDFKKNGKNIDGDVGKFELIVLGHVRSLRILNTTCEDEAMYECCFTENVTSCQLVVDEHKPEILTESMAPAAEAGESKLEVAPKTQTETVELSAEICLEQPQLISESATSSVITMTQSQSADQIEASADISLKQSSEETSTSTKRLTESTTTEQLVTETRLEQLSINAETPPEQPLMSPSGEDLEATSAMSGSISELSSESRSTGRKPWFVRKLPSRLEIIEGQSFLINCHTGGAGCKPWFVKRFPARVEVERGIQVSMDCTFGKVTDDFMDIGSQGTSWILEQKSKKVGGQGVKPLPPASLYVTDYSDTGVIIEWTKPYTDGGSPLLHYALEKRDAGKTTWELLTNLPPDVTECELDNMASGKAYYIRVRAANQFGLSEPRSLEQPIKIKDDKREVPTRCGDPEIVNQLETSVTLTWNAPTWDGGSPLLHYILEKREMRGPRWVRVQKIAVAAPPYTVYDLVTGSEYQFRVYACNIVGVGEPSAMSKTIACRKQELEPARFVTQIQDATVEEGDKAVFECSITGSPVPEVKWFKNLRELFDGYKHKIQLEYVETGVLEPAAMDRQISISSTEGNETVQSGDIATVAEGSEADMQRPELSIVCRLVVNNVMAEDCGEVECRAFNPGGMDATRAQLSMHVAAQVKLTPRIYEGLTFTQGQTMKIRVPVLGHPMPKVTWVKDGEVLESEPGRVDAGCEDGNAVLVVMQCRRADRGMYGVKVENTYGVDEAVFEVEVTDCPLPPAGKPVVHDITSTTCQLDWQPPLDDGGAPVTSYIIEQLEVATDQQPSGQWRRLGTTYVRHMVVLNLAAERKYQFRVSAENMYGTSVFSEESEAITATGSAKSDSSLGMNYDALVMSDLATAHVKIDVDKMKSEAELHKKYIVCEELGRGTFGVAHRAIERTTGRNWVAKFVACTTIERAMVRQEIDIRNDLRHPNLLQLHEAFETEGEMAFILELVTGQDLLSRAVETDVEFTEKTVIKWLRQICQGVAHMHKNNIIHLDIRPENVMCTTSKSHDIKLVDFSIAQRVDPNRTVRVLFSTIEFCSPEILTFAPISYATDMWSLGVFAHVLLSGVSPFLGRTIDETYLNVTQAQELKLPDRGNWRLVSEFGKDWVTKLLVKDSKKRMNVMEALGHPWLNGEAEAEIPKVSLSVENIKKTLSRQKWRIVYDDKLPIGSLSHEGAVFLKLSQEGIAMERELFMELPDQAPQVVVELANTVAYEGTVGRFRCKFQGLPEPQVKWYHEDYELDKDNEKYNFWYKHGLAMLNIIDVDFEDVGQYACVATNRLGSCTTVGELNIQEMSSSRRGGSELRRRRRSLSYDRDSLPPDLRRSVSFERQTSMEHLTSTSGSVCGSAVESYSSGYGSCNARAAPHFVLPLVDQIVAVGLKCTFSVLVSSKSDVELSWFHDQLKVYPSDDPRYHIDGDTSNIQCLIVDDITAHDMGEWRCLATNSYGQCMCICHLDVVEVPPEGSHRPEFTQSLSRTIVVEGGVTKFECKVSGNPPPIVHWLKDRRPISDDGSYETTCEENELYTLCVNATYAEHTGWYSCVARNAAGTAISEAKLTVDRVDCESMLSAHSSFDRASLTDDVESVQTRTSLASLRRRRLTMTTAPQFTARLRPKRCLVGQLVRFSCCVSGMPVPDVTWSRADGTAILSSRRIKIQNNYGLCSLEITAARLDDSGLYILRAINVEGQISCSASLHVDSDNSTSATELKLVPGSRESTPHCPDWLLQRHSLTPVPPGDMLTVGVSGDFPPTQSALTPVPTADFSNLGMSSDFLTPLPTASFPPELSSDTELGHLPLAGMGEEYFSQNTGDRSRLTTFVETSEHWHEGQCSKVTTSTETSTRISRMPFDPSSTSASQHLLPVEERQKTVEGGVQSDKRDYSSFPSASVETRTLTLSSEIIPAITADHGSSSENPSTLLDMMERLLAFPSPDFLTVISGMPNSLPQFSKLLEDQTATVGSSVTLSCVLHLPYHIHWLKDGQEILPTDRVRFSTEMSGLHHTLSIADVEMSDAGRYLATLMDESQNVAETSAILTVLERSHITGCATDNVAVKTDAPGSSCSHSPSRAAAAGRDQTTTEQLNTSHRTTSAAGPAQDCETQPPVCGDITPDDVTSNDVINVHEPTGDQDTNRLTPEPGSRLELTPTRDITPTSDVTPDDVIDNKQPSIVQQLMDLSGTLGRFITLEYITDGGALTQALWSRLNDK